MKKLILESANSLNKFLKESGVIKAIIIEILGQKTSSSLFSILEPIKQKYDESKHAQLIAKHFNTNHVELNADEVEPEIFYKLIKHYDEPMVDSSMIPTYLLSKEIRKHCKVALGGDGADELFGGYEFYKTLKYQKTFSYEFEPLNN